MDAFASCDCTFSKSFLASLISLTWRLVLADWLSMALPCCLSLSVCIQDAMYFALLVQIDVQLSNRTTLLIMIEWVEFVVTRA